MTRAPLLWVGLPGCLAAAGAALWMLAGAAGVPPAAGRPLTLSEAAMLADHADVVRLVAQGANPNAPSRVRAGTLDFSEHWLSPLAAAVLSRQAGIVQVVIDAGATMSPATFPGLWCSASRLTNNEAVVALLDAHAPDGTSRPDCRAAPPVR